MGNNKKLVKKGIVVLLAGTMIGTMLVGCSNGNQKQEEITLISEEQNNEDILFEREDGSYLQLLVTHYSNTEKTSFNIGYVTYNKDGAYFDNVESGVRVKLSDESVFDNSVEFRYLQFSSLCDEKYLINGKISIDEVKNITNKITPCSGSNLSIVFNDKTIYTYKFYLRTESEWLAALNDPSTYSLGKGEPISEDINTYTDSDEAGTIAYSKK